MLRLALCFAFIVIVLIQPARAVDGYEFHEVSPDYHFVWPKELFSLEPNKFVDIKIDLPYLDNGTPKPANRSVYYIDLNGDGIKEIIVPLGRDGKQEAMGIFRLKGDNWIDIGTFENGCAFCSKWNGYYQLVDKGNGGGGVTSRRLLRFIRGKYREVRDEIYDNEVLTEVRINPKGLDD